MCVLLMTPLAKNATIFISMFVEIFFFFISAFVEIFAFFFFIPMFVESFGMLQLMHASMITSSHKSRLGKGRLSE